MQIDHLALWANDLEKLKAFYVTYFGCESNEKYTNVHKHFSSYFLTFSSGARIELMKREDIKSSQTTETIGLAHFAIRAGTRQEVEALTRKLEKDGFVVESFPRTTGDGYFESVILDPEGNKIELVAV